MDVFTKRLQELMNITQTEQKVLAKYCGTTIHVLKKMTNFFNTTSDYLLGLSDVEEINDLPQSTRMFSRCNEILEFNNELNLVMEKYKHIARRKIQ